MGIKEIQAYRAREVMTTGQFMKFWLDDYPGDDAYEVAKLLADVIEADAHCIHIANTNPDLDVWDEDQHKARRDLQSEAATTLRTLAASGKGLDAAPPTMLSRDVLAKTCEALKVPVPRFLYPPAAEDGFWNGRQCGTPAAAPVATDSEAAPDCHHTDDFRRVRWFGTTYTFSPNQARAVEVLWSHWEQGGLGLTQKVLGDLIDSRSDRFRMRDLFRLSGKTGEMHPAWNTMIHEVDRGMYALGRPGDFCTPK
ncbi:MAG TPA: hypothetical protein VN634_19750 [Candidatus Limnocylindrales bacterium]|nr:hypothetical protein [Candidatus Limnocylindrales bacterium]